MSDRSNPAPLFDENDQRVDDLVRRTAGSEIDRQAVDRLTQFWKKEMETSGRVWSRGWLAAAASVAMVAGTLSLFALSQWGGAFRTVVDAPPSGPVSPESASRGTQKQDPEDQTAERRTATTGDAGAHPTPYELLVMQAALPSRTSNQTDRTRAIRRHLIRRLNTLHQVDEHTGQQIAADLDITEKVLENELGRLCFILRGPGREAAVRLLSRIATENSLEILLTLWSQPSHQTTVGPAIARMADADVLARCYSEAGCTEMRHVLARALVDQLTPRDAQLVISLYSRAPQSKELLAALRTADAALVDALFGELDAESRRRRYAASHTLAALRRPDVSRRLVEYVAAGRRRQEALVALAASDEPLATAFISQAARNAVLASALQSALVRSRTSHPWYGG